VGKRIGAVLIGVLMIGAPLLVESAAGASTSAPSVAVAGRYRFHLNWQNGGWGSGPSVTLAKDHTGTDNIASKVTWTEANTTITFKATYHGTVTTGGFSTRAKPGTMSSNDGLSGTWYAVRAGSS
jgi:hypothetical protein